MVVERAPLCIEGRYRKLSRQLPQSPWVLDGERKCPSSEHEQLERHALDAFGAAATRFHAAGREDVDVRMLGGGRPFVLELLEAKAAEQAVAEALAALAARINGGGGPVEVEELRVCDASVIGGLLKEGEESHRKHYRCVVRLSRRVGAADVATLAGAGELRLQQKTPLRVLCRRTQAVRERAVYAMEAKILGLRFLLLDLTTQAAPTSSSSTATWGGRRPTWAPSSAARPTSQLDVVGLQGDKPPIPRPHRSHLRFTPHTSSPRWWARPCCCCTSPQSTMRRDFMPPTLTRLYRREREDAETVRRRWQVRRRFEMPLRRRSRRRGHGHTRRRTRNISGHELGMI